MPFKHHPTKPVIGIIGGIGSGKSTIARLFAREGCAVIDSDALSHEILQSPEIRNDLLALFGNGILEPDARISRKAVGQQVFGEKAKLARLNGLIHPRIAARRDQLMAAALADPGIRAVIWDSPLLIEAGLAAECDALVFVKVPREIRLERVKKNRGWSAEELDKREKLQIPLDKKAEIADYCIDNSGEEAHSLTQLQQVLSHLFPISHS